MAKSVEDVDKSLENLTTSERGTPSGAEPIPPGEFIDIHSNTTSSNATPDLVPDDRVPPRTHHQATDSGDEYVSADEGEDAELCKSKTDCADQCEEGRSTEDVGLTDNGERNSGDEDDDDAHPEQFEDTEGACAAEENDEDKEAVKEKEKKEEEARRRLEESLTDDEKQERKNTSQEQKEKGNQFFKEGNYEDAIVCYTQALEICPLVFLKERAIMFSNRAACRMKMEKNEEAIADSTKALDIHPHYLKALLRRAELYERTEKLDEALADYTKVVEMDPSHYASRAKCVKLGEEIKERNEKMKEEMMGKLKDLGNMILKPFGLSTENFNLQQDPNTGGYSVQFQQK